MQLWGIGVFSQTLKTSRPQDTTKYGRTYAIRISQRHHDDEQPGN
jgi:hypothetical protein